MDSKRHRWGIDGVCIDCGCTRIEAKGWAVYKLPFSKELLYRSPLCSAQYLLNSPDNQLSLFDLNVIAHDSI